MGLAGANKKRKISEDPRNTRWAGDTSRVGFKMLTAMGWNSDSKALNPTAPSAAPSTALTSIPLAKGDTLGLGATSQTAASTIFSRFGSKGLKFVSAGAGDVEKRRKTEGGEFASLLDRLNASASASPAPDSQEQRPKKKRKRKDQEDVLNVELEHEQVTPVLAPTIRNSSRARHIAAKRLALSNATDLAGILGYELPPTENVRPQLPVAAVDHVPDADETAADRAKRKAERKRAKAMARATDVANPDADRDFDKLSEKAARKAKRKAERARIRAGQ